jgi:hypothetical protein
MLLEQKKRQGARGRRRLGVTRTVVAAEAWPRLMRAETAARYVDEVSVEAFRRGVGSVYPGPIRVSGKGDRWVRDSLDEAIDRLGGGVQKLRDASDVL